MANHEILQEQYNDALFEMLLDDFASAEGELYEKEAERLRQDPSSGIPPETDQRILQLIERETAKASRHRSAKVFMKWLGRLAIAALIAAMLFCAAYALSPAFRVGTLNLLMRVDERVSSWQFSHGDFSFDSSEDNLNPTEVTIGWLPDGYERHVPKTQSPLSTEFYCTNSNGGSISIYIGSNNSSTYTLDIEDSDYHEDIYIQNNPGVLVIKNGTVRILWRDNNTESIILILSSDVDANTLIQIAESITLS